MSPVSPAVRALAQRVLAAELATLGEHDPLGPRLEQVFTRLHEATAAMVGDMGYLALVARAARITRDSCPWLHALPLPVAAQQATAFPRTGWSALIDAEGREPTAAGAVMLFGNVLGLLASFIGEDFTFRLVRRAWPDEGSTADRSAGSGET